MGCVPRIAKRFPNEDAWKEKIAELIQYEGTGSAIEALFECLRGDEEEKDEKKQEGDGSASLDDLCAVLCVNRMFAVLVIEIPPRSGVWNESETHRAYPIYGLRDKAAIT